MPHIKIMEFPIYLKFDNSRLSKVRISFHYSLNIIWRYHIASNQWNRKKLNKENPKKSIKQCSAEKADFNLIAVFYKTSAVVFLFNYILLECKAEWITQKQDARCKNSIFTKKYKNMKVWYI